ncbi:MAG: alpha/beta fold hydrolase [Mariniblastus sp.]|nr:alpha/beta fold hydrolase [Mariniblastus sp.]
MMHPRFRNLLFMALIAVMLTALSSGCRSHERKRASWNPPLPIAPRSAESLSRSDTNHSFTDLSFAEANYAKAMRLEDQGADQCVDFYFQTIQDVWPTIQQQLLETQHPQGRAGDLYRSASNKLITAGQKAGRFDPRSGLRVQTTSGWQTIPTAYFGFPWKPNQFNIVEPVGNYSTKDLIEYFRFPGVGVPTVVIRCREPEDQFMRKQQYFAATLLVRPRPDANGDFEIQFLNPINYSNVDVDGCSVPLRRDLSAPIAYRLKDEGRQYLTAFLQPGSTKNTTGLFMIQPYQPGKIPLVFVHGLLSDPLTWANIANELLVRPEMMEKYQIWVFEYATGEPFLRSAAVLRRHLEDARTHVDPEHQDPALDESVLIGHSMGGLVAKLQVSYSGDRVWQAVSSCPLESLRAPSDLRNQLASSFYFNPVPSVSRVIYIATPHGGSPWANRPVGRLGSVLVEEPSSQKAEHKQLVADNPCCFSREFTKRIPTSIDLLRPQSPLLKAISKLDNDPSVEFHSIIGIYRPMIGAFVSDGVVPTRSAIVSDVVTQKFVHAKHQKIHQSPQGISELLCILRTHFQNVDANQLPNDIAPQKASPSLSKPILQPSFSIQPISKVPLPAFREPHPTFNVLPDSVTFSRKLP